MDPKALARTTARFSVDLHPSTVTNVLGGVKDQLGALLLKYVDDFGAILLSYSNVKILTDKPIIHPYFPYFHLDVQADVLVFKPAAGMRLVGRVSLLGEDYISALVLGVFNATIPARKVHTDMKFLVEEEKWLHKKKPQHKIQLHSHIVFTVDEAKDNNGYYQILGSMLDSKSTGALDFLYPDVDLPADLDDYGIQGAAFLAGGQVGGPTYSFGRLGATTNGGESTSQQHGTTPAAKDQGKPKEDKKDKKQKKAAVATANGHASGLPQREATDGGAGAGAGGGGGGGGAQPQAAADGAEATPAAGKQRDGGSKKPKSKDEAAAQAQPGSQAQQQPGSTAHKRRRDSDDSPSGSDDSERRGKEVKKKHKKSDKKEEQGKKEKKEKKEKKKHKKDKE